MEKARPLASMTAVRQLVVSTWHGDRLDHAKPMWLARKTWPWNPHQLRRPGPSASVSGHRRWLQLLPALLLVTHLLAVLHYHPLFHL